MFEKIIIDQAPRHHTHTNTEQRAPTDESVRLLREMEEEAVKRIEKTLYLDNELKASMVLRKTGMIGDKGVTMLLKLNGKEYRLEVSLEPRFHTKKKALELLYKKMSDCIVREIVRQNMWVVSSFITGETKCQ